MFTSLWSINLQFLCSLFYSIIYILLILWILQLWYNLFNWLYIFFLCSLLYGTYLLSCTLLTYQVDTHVHASSGMNQKHLLRFIKKTMKDCKDDVVCKNKDGQSMTLAQVFTLFTELFFFITFLCLNVDLPNSFLSDRT